MPEPEAEEAERGLVHGTSTTGAPLSERYRSQRDRSMA